MVPSKKLKVAINTGGGDAPGLNAVIRSAVLCSLRRGWEVWGIRSGYDGLMGDGDGLVPLDADVVRGITHTGGTILGTSNRGNPFELPDDEGRPVDRGPQVAESFHRHGLDALVAIGG
ncbi:MAG: 6-phosphofructokinase, partial [Acidobacteria bacterium]|nr:6-phosphofructokinase [Acidobacteriota bacterium]